MIARSMTVRMGLMIVSLAFSPVHAADIEGVLPASLDQPRVYLAIAKDVKSAPLSAKGGGLAELVGDALAGGKTKTAAAGGKQGGGKDAGEQEPTGTFAVEAFLDTGASGVMLSKPTADALGLNGAKSADGRPIRFHDVGVGGGEAFAVTAPYCVRTSDFGENTEGDDLHAYAAALPNIRINVREESGLMDELTGGLDVAGMPVMAGKVMVVDCRPLAKYEKLRTSLVAPGDKSIPSVDSTINLTYVDFTRFTSMEPASAITTLGANPMIGPDPFNRADTSTPVTMMHGGKSATLTMLLDTGAASSMISVAKARQLGIEVDDSGKLTNVPAKEQFMLPIGGIGGSKNVNGFFIDALAVPVSKGEPIRYVKVPVLVLDIEVEDANTGETYTLDGVFGMNYLVASASVSGGLTGGGVDDLHDGAFEQFVIDHAAKTLGLKLKR